MNIYLGPMNSSHSDILTQLLLAWKLSGVSEALETDIEGDIWDTASLRYCPIELVECS